MNSSMPWRERLKKSRIIDAIRRDEPETLSEVLIEEGPNYSLDELSRALRLVAGTGQTECARVLIEKDKSLQHFHDDSGLTPLIIASKKGHSDILRLLIESGSKVNKASFRINTTPLHWAATNGYFRCIQLLLNAGADPDRRTIHGRTPLMMAARSNEPDIVMDLIMAKANVGARDYQLCTALHLAAEEGATECVKELLRSGAVPHPRMRTGDTPLMRAADKGHYEAMVAIIRTKKASLRTRGRQLSVMHWAAKGGSIECVRLLLDNDIDINIVTNDSYCGGDFIFNRGLTPLMIACQYGHGECVKYMLENGARHDLIDDEEMTAMVYAARYDNPACILQLLRGGANPNGLCEFDKSSITGHTYKGLSPLFVAIKRNSLSVIRILLHANCDITCMDRIGDEAVSPIEFALHHGKHQAAKLLVSYGFNLKYINSRILEDSLTELYNTDVDLANNIVQTLQKFPTLQQIARSSIREAMGFRTIDKIDCLPLPPALLKYVNMDFLEKIS